MALAGKAGPKLKTTLQGGFFYITIYLAKLLRSKVASTIANSCTSQASEKEAA
jgi:hypothetical protein